MNRAKILQKRSGVISPKKAGLALVAGAFLTTACLAMAQSVADPNLFSKKSVAVSSKYGSSPDPEVMVDGSGDEIFTFNDLQKTFTMSVSDFNSDIDVIRFYVPEGGVRLAEEVTVRYSSKPIFSTDDPSEYESAANDGQPYTLDIQSRSYINAADVSAKNGQLFYAEISDLKIPKGTQSVLFIFRNLDAINNDPENGFVGPYFIEIQAFPPAAKPAASTAKPRP